MARMREYNQENAAKHLHIFLLWPSSPPDKCHQIRIALFPSSDKFINLEQVKFHRFESKG